MYFHNDISSSLWNQTTACRPPKETMACFFHK